ncbi:MAG: hypothetical protein FWC73_05620 [Defluviitaleaceae bacterium]|nr:hypothetical protein [Defluviitaleaceae bacterium]
MMNLEKTNLTPVTASAMNRAESRNYYTLAQVQNANLPECMVERYSLSKTVKNLTRKIKKLGGRRDNCERQTHIQVC